MTRFVRAWAAADLDALVGSLTDEDGISHGAGRYVLTLAGDRIGAMTRFENGVLPWFGLPRSLPSR